MKKLLLLFSLPLALSANSFFNGSFELGTDGFALVRSLRSDTNPGLAFVPLKIVPGAPGAGKNALAIENLHAEFYHCFSKEFPLEPDTEYRLTAKVRGSKSGGVFNFRIFKVDTKWLAYTGTARPGTEWSDFEFVFKTEKLRGNGWHHLMICPPDTKGMTDISLFVDDMRLEKVGAPLPERLTAVAVPEKKLYLRGDTANVALKVYSPGAAFSGNIVVRGTDEYTGKLLFSETVPVRVPAGEAAKIALKPWKLDRFGGVRITVSGAEFAAHDSFFAVIGEYKAKPFDIFHDPVVGFNSGLMCTLRPLGSAPSFWVFNSPFEERFELLSKAGCRILRDHDGGVRGVDWAVVEQERGKFDFSLLDRQLAVYDKYHITLFPVIGEGPFDNRALPWMGPKLPAWAKPLSVPVKNDPPNTASFFRGKVLLPPVEAYGNYIEQTVAHVRGKVPVYEVVNEPNLFLGPDVYVRYLKAAHKGIRKADPAAKIAGFCITSDFGTQAGPWLDQCVKEGGLNYVDSVGFHPYSSRKLGSIRPADDDIAAIRKSLAAYGKGSMPLWNTELYYLGEKVGENVGDTVEPAENTAEDIVQRFIVDAGEGVVQSISLYADSIWKRLLTPHYRTGRNFHELVPSEQFVACNTLARLFEGVKPVKKIRYPLGAVCYAFRKDGKLIAAVWEYQTRKGVYADFGKFEVMDLFGNAEKSGEKELSAAPFYLMQGNLSDAEFISALENLSFRLDQPVEGSRIGRRFGDTLVVTLHNESGKAESGIAGVTGGGIAAVAPVRFTVPARSSLALEIPVRDVKPNGKKTDLLIVIRGNTFRTPLETVTNQLVGRAFKMKNAEGRVEFGNGKITVKMTVQDSTDAGASGKRAPWQTDCTEFFFDTDPFTIPQHNPQAYTDRTFRVFVTPRDAKKLHVMGIDAGKCKLDVTQNAEGYTMTLVIEAKTGRYLGFDVKTDDLDGAKMNESQLGNGKELYKNRCNFSVVK